MTVLVAVYRPYPTKEIEWERGLAKREEREGNGQRERERERDRNKEYVRKKKKKEKKEKTRFWKEGENEKGVRG